MPLPPGYKLIWIPAHCQLGLTLEVLTPVDVESSEFFDHFDPARLLNDEFIQEILDYYFPNEFRTFNSCQEALGKLKPVGLPIRFAGCVFNEKQDRV